MLVDRGAARGGGRSCQTSIAGTATDERRQAIVGPKPRARGQARLTDLATLWTVWQRSVFRKYRRRRVASNTWYWQAAARLKRAALAAPLADRPAPAGRTVGRA